VWALIAISIAVLVGFAIFVLRNHAHEQKRDIERETQERVRRSRRAF
jgi:low affinity Fe/Cu permease